MKAGPLNEIIEILSPTQIINDYGEREETFIKTYDTRAGVSWDSGNRVIENDEIFHNYTKTFTVRSYVPVNENCHIKWQDNYYRIITIEKRRTFNGKLIRAELINE